MSLAWISCDRSLTLVVVVAAAAAVLVVVCGNFASSAQMGLLSDLLHWFAVCSLVSMAHDLQ